MDGAAGGLTAANYDFLRGLLQEETGLVLSAGKEYLVTSRLGPVVEQEGLGSLDALCAALRGGSRGELKRRVAETVTINETMFFRDPPLFQALGETVLPGIRDRHAGRRRVAVWSAAAASGQEAYSVAMLLVEAGFAGWDVELTGTDVSAAMVERARTGRYRQMEVSRGLPVTYLVRHFRKVGVDWEIDEGLRRMARFLRFDLREPLAGAPPFDLILCRNVLLYFDAATRARVVDHLYRALAPDGWLVLGAAETLPRSETRFEPVPLGRALLYRLRQGEERGR